MCLYSCDVIPDVLAEDAAVKEGHGAFSALYVFFVIQII
jgi:hypothetical protein